MNPDENDRLEGEPLLAADERETEDVAAEESPEFGAKLPRHGFISQFQARKPKTIVLLLAILLFTVTTSGMLIIVPIFRLIEDAVCHSYYKKDHSEKIDERLCKVDEVQGLLAYLGGWAAMLNTVIGLIATLPYGVLADRIGRKPTFILAYIGILLAFGWSPLMLGIVQTTNLYLVMLGSLFFLIGGGIPVAMNSLTAMAADVSSEAEKSTSFLYLSFGAVLGTLVGPVTAGILMEKISPWVPIISVFFITPFVFILLLFVPETLSIRLKGPSTEDAPAPSTAKKPFREAADELLVSVSLLKNANILICMLNFFIQPAIFAAYSATLGQYVSKYFGWTLAETSYLLSPPLGILHLVIILLVPWVSSVLTSSTGRFRLSVFKKDLLITRVSLLLMIIAAVMEGFSQEIVLFLVGLTIGTFGSANGPLLRAIATSYVEPNQTSRLYALMSLMETGGAIIGGPVLAQCFNIGLAKKGLWRGLPWFYVAALIGISLVALMFLQKPPSKPEPEEQDTGDLGYQSAEEPV
ncbi:general substrate transporter [Podospora aff. communis PSN243]|uniref:General substrate transporter n=1 Tax=Podospora aff. communis PSN243 TaxID=3040156 RepID=A0AAV9GFS3_9PEZI|nr:general substrate transporter [Podospora aff. communis PSN243]